MSTFNLIYKHLEALPLLIFKENLFTLLSTFTVKLLLRC